MELVGLCHLYGEHRLKAFFFAVKYRKCSTRQAISTPVLKSAASFLKDCAVEANRAEPETARLGQSFGA
jgi:hypothetical protein